VIILNLSSAKEGIEYTISGINIEDDELNSFLFTLGCYEGEKISLISRKKKNFIVSLKDARYCIDKALADAISVA
jgi:Fe2+ transport system protein FeoA